MSLHRCSQRRPKAADQYQDPGGSIGCAELESRNVSQKEPMETITASSPDDFAHVDAIEPMSDPVDIEFDIQAATETILPYVFNSRPDSLDAGQGTGLPISYSNIPGSSISSGETSGGPQVLSSQDPSSKSTPVDSALPLIGLGLEEALPSQEVQDDLFRLFFNNVYLYMPAIHPKRFLARAQLSPSSNLRPPPCLLYAMWALAASTTESYRPVQDVFYQRARKYAELDEMKSLGQLVCTVAHIQTWALLCLYESFNMFLVRSFLSERKAAALCIAAGLHKLDGVGLATSQFLGPAEDWTDLEERRRIFWCIFMHDRFLCAGSGFTPAFDEQDIQTDLPSPEDAYENGTFARGMKLSEAMTPAGARNVSVLGARAVLASLFGRVVVQLHRPDPDGKSIDDMDSSFWKSYRSIDNVLVNTAVCFPDSMAKWGRLGPLNVDFLNIATRACAISLHQSAIFTAGKNPRLAEISRNAKSRCMESAREMANIVQQIPDKIMLLTPPFTSFCVYVAARVFAVALKEAPAQETETLWEALQYMQSRLELIKTTRPYTANLIKQLNSDLESLGDLNPTGHIIVKATPEDGADGNSNASPVNATSSSKTSPVASQPNLQAQPSFKSGHFRSTSHGVLPEVVDKRPSYLSRAYTDPDPDYPPGSMNTIPPSFMRGPTSVPMDDLLWTPDTNNEMFTVQPNYTRAGSAPPGLIDMSMMDSMDPVEIQMSMAQSTFGLYSASDPSQPPMDFSNAWSADLVWDTSHG
ncbi:hypothetical protein H2200_009064 [Cladophialophora chaetospira]|uniref:Xylanolytic transcriptional activator regulatory domain-containing protein n=1 Tax=Cladophialophora chaetospira TaxID=386627 RepID=A0AA38X3P2_9EURO|nr:hypothetical protein H2200_009064 [Cladophialophora chaetospira]